MTVAALGLGIVGRILSPSLVLDLVALWPLAVLAVPAIFLGLAGGRRRALAPLVLLSWLFVGVGLHLGSFTGLPSAAAAVDIDVSGADSGRLALSAADVTVSVRAGPFSIRPQPIGGIGGVPVVEQVAGGTAVSLTVTDDRTRSEWFRFGAWDMDVPVGTAWDLRLSARSVDADLSEVSVVRAQIVAEVGTVRLGEVGQETVVEVDGDVAVLVPTGSAVTVVGEASVPAAWTSTSSGATSPTDGVGWRIEVVGGSVRIAEV